MSNDKAISDLDRIAARIEYDEVLANVSFLVSKLAEHADDIPDAEVLDDLMVKECIVYCPYQYRYVIDLDERGEYRASVYHIDEKTGEDSQEPVMKLTEEFFQEGGELEGVIPPRLGNLADAHMESLADHLAGVLGHAVSQLLDEVEQPAYENIDPVEALEHWIVTPWLFDKLEQHGEMVQEFMGLNIWRRTESGQAIRQDSVIRRIAQEIVNR